MNEFERRHLRGSKKPSEEQQEPTWVKRPRHRRRRSLSAKQRRFVLIAAAVLLTVVIGVLLGVFFFSMNRSEIPESVIPSDISRTENSTDLAYDKDANRIDAEKYTETILPESGNGTRRRSAAASP